MTEGKRKSRFVPGLLLYLLLLALLLAAALFVFRDFLTYYEMTRPARAVEAYRAALQEQCPGEGARDGLAGLDRKLQNEEEALRFVRDKLREARIVEDVSRSREEERVYRVVAEGISCGELRFRQQTPLRYGFAPWALSEEHYDFSPWFYRLSVTVPPDYRVSCGGVELGKDYVAEKDIPYQTLGNAYELLEGLPTQLRYETGALIYDTELTVCDPSGRVLPEEEQSEAFYLDNCSPERREQMLAFAQSFVSGYVHFTSVKTDFNLLKSLVVPGSEIDRRLNQAVGENWWSGAGRCTLLEVRPNCCLDLGDGRYLLDLSYETETQELQELVHDIYNARFALLEQNGKLLAEHFFNY